MNSLSERIAGLPPARRELYAKLLESKSRRGSAAAPVPPLQPPVALNSAKIEYRRFYDAVTKQLDATIFGQFSFFLNYGYEVDHHPRHAAVDVPEQCINKNSVRLVLELIGDCPLSGTRVLDVGCGRGGTVHVISTMFDARSVTGLDLSPQAIAFCRQAHTAPHVTFHEGDAEQLPFADGAFDVVTNVESSHSYPAIADFYAGVFRVLSPGGAFLYTDLLPVEQMDTNVRTLLGLGFVLERDTDITPNVLLSCDEVARTRVKAFSAENDSTLMQNFLATPESQVYGEMKSGRWRYRILRLRKPRG